MLADTLQVARTIRTTLILLAAAGCTSSDILENHITIQQGIYGELSTASDVAGRPDGTFADGAVTAFQLNGTQLAATTSDGGGVYQLEIDAGTLVVCTLGADPSTLADQRQHNCAGMCTQLVVPNGRLRADWASNLSGGWWSVGDHCP